MRDGHLAGQGPVRVCFPFLGEEIGGSHISALKLIQGFDCGRVAPVVVVEHGEGPLAALLKQEGLRHVCLPMPRTLSPREGFLRNLPAYLSGTLPLIRRFIRKGAFDVVHTNDGPTHVTWGLAARLAGVKLVWHHRGDPAARGANLVAPLIADHMVTVSRFARPSRPVLSLARRLSVIHSPFEQPVSRPDREAAKSSLLAELDLPPGTRVLGYFGQLVGRKRPLLFVEAIDRIRRRYPEIPVVGCLFGVPPSSEPDAAIAVRRRVEQLGLERFVRLMGFRRPVEPYMTATDVLLIPAVSEPFGRTLIEAMFLGTPVVAVAHGGNPEAIEHDRTGFLVAPENPDAFVEPVVRLLSDPSLFARISGAAREAALRSYSVDIHVEQVMDVYRRVLKLCGAGRPVAELNEGFP